VLAPLAGYSAMASASILVQDIGIGESDD